MDGANDDMISPARCYGGTRDINPVIPAAQSSTTKSYHTYGRVDIFSN